MPHLAQLIVLLRLATKDRAQLVLENVALRPRRAVDSRSLGCPIIDDGDGQGLGNDLIDGDPKSTTVGEVRCDERLGGLLRFYQRAA